MPDKTCPKGYVCLAKTEISTVSKDTPVYMDPNVDLTKVNFPLQCPKGYKCSAGTGGFNNGIALEPIPCGLNQYTNITGQYKCIDCLIDHECTDPTGVNITPVKCGVGYYRGNNDLK
jgi:hypothetical protein